MALYPDISHWQTVNGSWSQIKQNCGFIIFKATQGTDFTDPKVASFIKGAESVGLPYFLYTYLNKGNELAQAQYLVRVGKSMAGKYFKGYMLDVEEGNSAAGVQAALNYLKGLGKKVILYTMHAQYHIYKGVIEGRGPSVCWMEARYGKNNGAYSSAYPCHTGVDLHQYTSNGRCPGIAGNVDLSRLTGTKTEAWFTGGAAPAPSTPSTPSTSTGLVFQYEVRAGGKTYPIVKNLNSYAGARGKAITDIAIKVNKGSVKYRVHVKGGKWLPYVTGYNWKDVNNGYAGNGKPIDAVQVILFGVSGQVAQYRVSPLNKDYYPWQFNANTGKGQDGYAGAFGKTIDRFQVY